MAFNLLVNGLDCGTLCFVEDRPLYVSDVKVNVIKRLIGEGHQNVGYDFKLYSKGIFLEDDDEVEPDNDKDLVSVEVIGSLLGGKGGFGALIRAMGKSVENSRNKDACRDLSGRRVRDVETEKKLTEWVKKDTQSSKNGEEEKIKKLEDKLAQPKHMFSDAKYMEQIRTVSETMEDSLKQGLQAAGSSNGTKANKKRSVQSSPPSSSKAKKPLIWFDVEGGSDDSEDEVEGGPPVDLPAVKSVTRNGLGLEGSSPEPQGSASSSSDHVPKDSQMEHVAGCDNIAPTPDNIVTPRPLSNKSVLQDQHTVQIPSPDQPAPVPPSDQPAPVPPSDQYTVQVPPSDQPAPVPPSDQPAPLPPSDEPAPVPPSDQPAPVPPSDQPAPVPPSDQPTPVPPSDQPAPVPPSDQPAPVPPLNEPVSIDLTMYSSAKDLESVGPDVLKSVLQSLGLKCGGTLQQRAERLFSTSGKEREEWDPQILAKPSKRKK